MLFVALALWGVTVPAPASTNWTGVWRITAFTSGSASGIYHVVVSGEKEEQVQVYDEMGRQLGLLSAGFEGKRLSLVSTRSQRKPLPLSFEAARRDGRLEGEWSFFHPQYKAGGELSGVRVMSSSRWIPFEELHKQRKNGFVDVSGFLLESAPLKNLQQFLAFWDRQVEPIYYLLSQRWLYGSGNDPGRKKKQLTRVFRLLKGVAPQSVFVKNFASLVKTASRQIKARVQGQERRFYVVSSVGPEPVSSLRLWSRSPAADDGVEKCCSDLVVESLEEDYLVFNPFELASNPEIAAILVRKGILLLTLWSEPSRDLATEVFRHGLSLYLALDLEGKAFPSFPERKLPHYKDELRSDLSKSWGETGYRPLAAQMDLSECLGCVVGYDFARTLLTTRSLKEVLRLNDSEVADEWTRYLSPPRSR